MIKSLVMCLQSILEAGRRCRAFLSFDNHIGGRQRDVESAKKCPRGVSPAPSSISSLLTLRVTTGAPPTHAPTGRPFAPHEPKGSRQASSGSMYAAQAEELLTKGDVAAGIILINDIRVKELFNTGALHSFINRTFAILHKIKLVQLSHIGKVHVLVILCMQ